jgi:hypothetical protein
MAITKVLVSIVIAVGSAVAVAAPASATNPNPFGDLSCNCRGATPAQSEQINRGIRDGLAVVVPGLPAARPHPSPAP